MKKQTLILSVAAIVLGVCGMLKNNPSPVNDIQLLNFIGSAGLVFLGVSVIICLTVLKGTKKAVA